MDHAHDHHDGDERGGVQDGLGHPLESLAGKLVHDEREDDRDGEGHQQPDGVDRQRVDHQAFELERRHERYEVVQSHPGAPEEAVHGVVLAKGDLSPVHRPVLEDDQ
eukprot:Nk52_evm1s2201 gene=Nk52_evmTU1s2201